ncbi:PQQ-binding-like beta-propeller repeat protein [Steroidobacter flavus]|uniref:PQQ-binding-like beta-propeller repeat protein n=2 Tax=Steroidobacter flavus TaxID=1842136 RepID=A0ABV8T2P2_9GAMM
MSLLLGTILASSTLSLSGAAELGSNQDVPTPEQVEAKCKDRLSRDFGDFGSEWVQSMVRSATPDQLVQLFERCEPAYPTRKVDGAASERGRALYTSLGCAFCHGNDIRGGNGGPSLLRSQLVMRDRQGEAIARVVLRGVPNTVMPSFPLKANEIADIAEFLHSFDVTSGGAAEGGTSTSIVTGSAAAGANYFERHCADCHSTSADLSGIAAKYSDPKRLQQRWLMPQRSTPVIASVTMADGQSIEGQVVRSDEFRVVLRVGANRQLVFHRSAENFRISVRDPLARHKELLPTYSDRDIHDVTAYLQTLTQPSPTPPAIRGSTRKEAELVKEQALLDDTSRNSGLTPDAILNPVPGSWPTYSGDYSGRRYSSLKKINQSNVNHLTLAWTTRLTAGPDDRGPHPVIIAGDGKQTSSNTTALADVRGSILQVDGVLYASSPDNAWAIDARTGDVLWHFNWKTRGAMRLGNRGLGMWGHFLYLATPDNYLVSIDSRTGEKRWQVEIASFEQQYFSSSPAPIVVGNRVLVGTANLLNAPGFLKSYDAATGDLQWTHYSVPMDAEDPGLRTWKDLDAARHGGGMVWIPGSYDADTNLYIYGTGNPTPAYMADQRGNGDALYTCSIIAVDVSTGRRVWHYQLSPNDTHDWDAGLTPVLADISIKGRVRKVVMAAARNGYFFVMDRITGENLLTSKFSSSANWAYPDLNAHGQPIRIPAKDHHISGALVSPANQGAANWYPASYSPDYELLFVSAAESWAMYYSTSSDAGGANSLQGKSEVAVDGDYYLKAISPKTGTTAWSVKYSSAGSLSSGILTTAGKLLFAGDADGNLVARDPGSGTPLWNARLQKVTNAPQTYLLDGEQYVLVASGDTLYSFKLKSK